MIRPARDADAPEIAALWSDLIRETAVTFNPIEKTADDVRSILAADGTAGYPFLVAEHGGQVVGFARYFQFRGGAGYARTMEHSIMLDARARGLGLGRGLMAALEDHARAAGVHSLWAGVSGENPDGVTFHKAMGFREIATLPEVGFKFGRWMDLVLLQKIL